MPPRRTRSDWDAYIRRFHQDRPGITEAVLSRAHHHARTPYQWLTEDLPRSGVVLDLACGSAPTRHIVGAGWVGVDTSLAELEAAGAARTGRAVLGDIAQLPLREASCDAIICSMALMLVEPLDATVREMARVIRPHGVIRILLPARAPLTVRDRIRYTQLAIALRTSTWFPPNRLGAHAGEQLEEAGLSILDQETRRFAYPIRSSDDADRLVDSLYLPDVRPHHVHAAQRVAARWVGHDLGVPLQRITATTGTETEPRTEPPRHARCR